MSPPQQTAATDLWDDLYLDFPAELAQLPQLTAPSDELKEALDKLHALFEAVPWGVALPSVQFVHLGVQPCFIHGLVGDTIWQQCWKDRHTGITQSHAVPHKLMNVARHALQALAPVQTDTLRTEGGERYKAVTKQAESRRRGGGPY